jgi:ATP-binding cassette subfamily F protein 3
MILDVQNVSKTFSGNEVLKNASFHIEDREKAALVGINGAGKSTLLKIIMQILPPDEGTAVLSRGKTIGYLSQQPDLSGGLSVYDQLLAVKADVMELEKNMRLSEKRMKSLRDGELDSEMQRYARMTEEFERAGGYALKSEATGVLKGLGFSEEDFGKDASVLSGGQKTRVVLGRLLLSSPDIILLDEPTNHLDLPSILWLETYLQNYRGAVLVVSHDRYFLNKIVTKVIEVDRGRVTSWSGSYDDYSLKKAEAWHAAALAYMKAERERKHQEAVIKKLESFNREKSIRRAESRKKVLEKMTMPEKPVEENAEMRFFVKPRIESGHDVLSAENLTKAFDGRTLFSSISFSIFRGERIALIGGNGTGKSTILKIINGLLAPDAGEIRLGTHVHVGYYDQEMAVLHSEKTIFEEISDSYPTLTATQIRLTLAAFLFTGEDVFKKIESLSGGERARVSLAKLMLSEANFLILDEPTNHLDIQSKEILENALRSYEGTVLCVSHDRYFINRTATRILELSNRTLTSSMGSYDDFMAWKETQAAKISEDASFSGSIPSSDAASADVSGSKDEWKAKKAEEARIRKRKSDLEKAEKKILSLEEEDHAVDEQLSNPEIACNPARCIELSARKDEIESEIEKAYSLWNDLQEED